LKIELPIAKERRRPEGVTPLWSMMVAVRAEVDRDPAATAVAARTGPEVEAADAPKTNSPAGTDLKLTYVSIVSAAAGTKFEPIEMFTVFDVDTPTRATVARDD
jgi:hypothetical protein